MGIWDLEALEMAIRSSMHQMGGLLLEKLMNSDAGDYGGARIDCGQGHQAHFVEYRSKQLTTVLSPVKVERAYYHCEGCGSGIVPKDRDLDIVGTSFSPGVRRLMGRVGAKEPFAEGQQDLEELAGIVVHTKEVERVSESLGEEAEMISQQERDLALSGRLVQLPERRHTPNRKIRLRRPKPTAIKLLVVPGPLMPKPRGGSNE